MCVCVCVIALPVIISCNAKQEKTTTTLQAGPTSPQQIVNSTGTEVATNAVATNSGTPKKTTQTSPIAPSPQKTTQTNPVVTSPQTLPSAEESEQSTCTGEGKIWSGKCYNSYSELTSQALCTSASPSAGAWVNSTCVKAIAATSAGACTSSPNNGFWIASMSPAVCLAASQMNDALCTNQNACQKTSSGFSVYKAPTSSTPTDAATCISSNGWWIASNSPASCIGANQMTNALCTSQNGCGPALIGGNVVYIRQPVPTTNCTDGVEQCYWLDSVTGDWILNTPDKSICAQKNSQCGSGGGCYKWAKGPLCPALAL